MAGGFPYEVRAAYRDDWDKAIELAWKTFLKYEAEDYTKQGVENFNNFITDNNLYQRFCEGKYPMFVAYDQDKIIGMITLRNESHISLLFVDEKYHKQGVGRALIHCMFEFEKEQFKQWRTTVFASPYGKEFYHRLGFSDIGPEMERDGIRYTPMEYMLK